MRALNFIAVFCLAAGFSSWVQAGEALDGKWAARWEVDGRPYQAVLNIAGQGGTWNAYSKLLKNRCSSVEAPVIVESAADESIAVTLAFSKALQGCTDVMLKLKRSDSKTLVGTRESGEQKSAAITLTRD